MALIYPDYDSLYNKDKFTNFSLIKPSKNLSKAKVPDVTCDNLIATFNTFGKKDFYHVGVNGTSDQSQGKGSFRLTNYDVDFAKYLTKLLLNSTEHPTISLDEYSDVDWQTNNPAKLSKWMFIGVSPVFRYMEYTQGSEHFPHYDAPYYTKEDPLTRTLMSGVLYLTTNKSGATGFINDNQMSIPFKERDLSDWKQQATYDQVSAWELPQKGSLVLFPHQTCHTVFPLLEDEKRIIIRFDLYFKAIS